MNYQIQVNQDIFVLVTFDVVPLPDNDYNIEVSTMEFIHADSGKVSLSDFKHDEQKQLLDDANEAIDAYIDANHEALYRMSAKGSMPTPPKGLLH